MAEYDRALKLTQKKIPDLAGAHILLEQAYRNGDARAAYALGTWALHGAEPYVKRNLKHAVRLLKEAASAGVREARYDLAVCYQRGEGVAKNESRAFELYLSAALQGDVDSIVEVARCFKYGYGVERNNRAFKVFRDHAEAIDQS